MGLLAAAAGLVACPALALGGLGLPEILVIFVIFGFLAGGATLVILVVTRLVTAGQTKALTIASKPCRHCGQQIPDIGAFCPLCGQRIV
jgi:hypothetical protein